MEVLFENQFTMTKEAAIEISKVTTHRYRFFSFLTIALCIMAIIIYFIVFGFNWFLFTLWGIILIGASIIPARIVRITGTKLYQQQLVLHNHKPIVKIVTIFEEHMESHSANGSHLTISYDRITSVKKTAHFMILIYEKKVIVPIELFGFTKGTPEAFESFLLKKGIKVK